MLNIKKGGGVTRNLTFVDKEQFLVGKEQSKLILAEQRILTLRDYGVVSQTDPAPLLKECDELKSDLTNIQEGLTNQERMAAETRAELGSRNIAVPDPKTDSYDTPSEPFDPY